MRRAPDPTRWAREIFGFWPISPWTGWTTMSSSLKERLPRPGPLRGRAPVPSRSPLLRSLRVGPNPKRLKTVSAALALAKRGISLLRAKRAIEEMIETGRAVILVPKVESEITLGKELTEAGCIAASVAAHQVDVRELRER